MTGDNELPQPANATEVEQMGAFVEDALTSEDAEKSGLELNQDGKAIV